MRGQQMAFNCDVEVGTFFDTAHLVVSHAPCPITSVPINFIIDDLIAV
jgi:hypothetical protein